MFTSTKAIVLSKLRYSDHDLIVKCYTQQFGVVSYLLKGVLNNKRGTTKTAYFQLLSQLQITSHHRENRSLQTIKDVKLNHHYISLQTNVLKTSVVMFLAEVLLSVLIEAEQNDTLFSYLEATLLWLDNHSECSNFHLLFLLNLTKHLGFYPDTSNIDYEYFNLYDGKFQNKKIEKYSISGENLMLLKQLLGTTFDTLPLIKIKAKQRQSFLNMFLLYFELHLGSFKKPKSLHIFNQVFS
jgi:DNA repair protein RecO (recombination protein O)